ncbi:MAG: DUF92 domain-containing protein [Candidatus Omnitrophota bacterium]
MNDMVKRLLIGFAVNLAFGMVAFMREMVDDTGFFAGVVLFTLVYVFMGWQAYTIIIGFFIMMGLAINLENKDKARKGEFELYKAKRTYERVLGRSLAGAIFAALYFLTERPEFKVAFVAGYAEAICDTVSTKLGKALSRDALSIMTLRKVRHGTPGGISVPGTTFGIIAAVLLGGVAFAVRLITSQELYIVIPSALIGAAADSFLNAFSYQKKRIPNELINVLGSVIAGLFAIWGYWLLHGPLGIKP